MNLTLHGGPHDGTTIQWSGHPPLHIDRAVQRSSPKRVRNAKFVIVPSDTQESVAVCKIVRYALRLDRKSGAEYDYEGVIG